MFRVAVASVVLLTGSVIAAEPPVAPQPRPARPDLSIVVIELVPKAEGIAHTGRVGRAGVRNGRLIPSETIWEGDPRFVNSFSKHHVVQDRFLVTNSGAVFDINQKKMINDERDGDFCRIDGTKVIY